MAQFNWNMRISSRCIYCLWCWCYRRCCCCQSTAQALKNKTTNEHTYCDCTRRRLKVNTTEIGTDWVFSLSFEWRLFGVQCYGYSPFPSNIFSNIFSLNKNIYSDFNLECNTHSMFITFPRCLAQNEKRKGKSRKKKKRIANGERWKNRGKWWLLECHKGIKCHRLKFHQMRSKVFFN